MSRKVLLVEPNYKNKYPPMGLMKIATYYRKLGDDVTFFKGDLKELVLNDTYEALLKQLYVNDDSIFWEQYKPQICQYLKRGTIRNSAGQRKYYYLGIIKILSQVFS